MEAGVPLAEYVQTRGALAVRKCTYIYIYIYTCIYIYIYIYIYIEIPNGKMI